MSIKPDTPVTTKQVDNLFHQSWAYLQHKIGQLQLDFASRQEDAAQLAVKG